MAETIHVVAFGATNDVRARVEAVEGETFTLGAVSATISLQSTGAVVRAALVGYASGDEMGVHEAFTTANGYAEGGVYIAEFRSTAQVGATGYANTYGRCVFRLTEVNDVSSIIIQIQG